MEYLAEYIRYRVFSKLISTTQPVHTVYSSWVGLAGTPNMNNPLRTIHCWQDVVPLTFAIVTLAPTILYERSINF